jgi:hypothetical protein
MSKRSFAAGLPDNQIATNPDDNTPFASEVLCFPDYFLAE